MAQLKLLKCKIFLCEYACNLKESYFTIFLFFAYRITGDPGAVEAAKELVTEILNQNDDREMGGFGGNIFIFHTYKIIYPQQIFFLS